MKKIEELLNIDLGRKLDTPKKLNRSSRQVPPEIVEQLENGEFTSEMIEALSKKFPIFYYRTCLTIHGAWPTVERDRIGGYKNVIQNKNGSLEIRWSAIDTGKIKAIREGSEGTGSEYRYHEDSNTRDFSKMKVITKETYPEILQTMKKEAEELKKLPIYGYLNLYTAATPWGVTYLVLSVHTLAIKSEDVTAVILGFNGLSYPVWQEKRTAYLTEQNRKQAEYEKEREERAQAAAISKERIDKEMKEIYLPSIAHLPECTDIKKGILVTCYYSIETNCIKYKYYKYTGPGAFGRVKWQYATSRKLNLEELIWKDKTQEPAKELERQLKGCRLFKSNQGKTTPRVPQAGVLMTINY